MTRRTCCICLTEFFLFFSKAKFAKFKQFYKNMELTEKTEGESHSVVPESLSHMDYTVHGILQVRILEWVALPFSRGSSQPQDQTQVSCIAGGSLPSEPPGKPPNKSSPFKIQLQIHTYGMIIAKQGTEQCRMVSFT